ncbi:MAG: cytosine permease [Anaerotignum propionicum]|uniref:NCS1 family nucleobase:cation symporter-1 n=1 Tax=Anaerotignum propionicum TaxID=28446 RepID=UPI002B1F4698|nr:cytosine permease [Anaerotignum propionicum]MEA5057382.1 cytosine permease [Anaerotignum propionicum]
MSKYTQQEKNGLYELTPEATAELSNSHYYNSDLAPTTVNERTWNAFSICNLWVGMSICVPSLALASSLVALGISPMLAVVNVILGNLIVLIPIQLNSKIGTKYGIPFPIFSRMTFGNKGTQLPTFSRSIIACGWTAVQSWVGGGAIAALIGVAIPMFSDQSMKVALPGNDGVVVGQLIGFFLFMLLVFVVAYNGMEKVKWVQNIGGPILIIVILGLLMWSLNAISGSGHSLGDVFAVGNDATLIEQNGGFTFVFMAGLTGNIAFWSTMALNIPDFSRFAKSQKSQFMGQLVGMPIPMALCAFVGALFAQATKYTVGEALFDPTSVFYYVDNKLLVAICAVGVIMATITTCVAANVVAPANGFSNMSPKKISYKKGVIITCLIATFVTQPWWIYGSGASYIFNWLNNYGTIIAPVAAILIADYFICKKQLVDVAGLYQGEGGRYWYSGGWNKNAMIAWGVSFIIPLIGNTALKYHAGSGLKPNFIQFLAANGYMVSFLIAIVVYVALMKTEQGNVSYGFVSQEEHEGFTMNDN